MTAMARKPSVPWLLVAAIVAACSSGTALAHGYSRSTSAKLSFSVPTTVASGARVLVTGKVAGAPRGAQTVFQWQRRKQWVSLGRTSVVHSRFKLSVLVPSGQSVLRVRAVILSGRRQLAVSAIRELTVRLAGHGVKAAGPTTIAPRATPPTATPSTPGPTEPTPPGPIAVTSATTTVMVGSVKTFALPEPLQSVASVASATGGPAGASVELREGQLSVTASAGATPGTGSIAITGSGCIIAECGREFVMEVPVTVIPLESPSGTLESFTEPSPDRIAAAVNEELSDELLITLGTPAQPGSQAQADAAAAAVGGVVSGGITEIGVYEVRWPAAQDLAQRESELKAQDDVTAAGSVPIESYSDDAAYPVAPQFETPELTWPFEQVDATSAWSQSTGSSIRVGIVDQGLVFAHEDLNVAQVLTNASIYFPAEHATRVAGMACAKGQIGTVGMAWGCPIVTAGTGTFYNTTVLEAVRRMAKEGNVKVVNISLGSGPTYGGCATPAQDAIFAKWDAEGKEAFRHVFAGKYGKNIVWTIAAGNNCSPGVASEWGANSDLHNVIAVAATNSDGSLARFSNYGEGVNVAAPGGMAVPPLTPNKGLMSTIPVGCPAGYCSGYDEEMGTSFAAPIVAGIAADVWQKHPTMTAEEIRNCITSTAGSPGAWDYATEQSSYPKGWTPYVTYPGGAIPIVDAGAAVACETPVPTEQATPMGPTSGPAGFGMQVSLPSCTYLAVSFDGTQGYVQSEYSPSTTFDVVTTPTLTDGQHQMSFACESSVSGTVLWRSPGFSITITGGPIALGLQSTTVSPGEAIVYTSGPSESSTTCPPLPGVTLYGLSIYLDTPNGLSVAASRFITMPDDATTEALTVPPDSPAGAYTALERCYYSGINQLGIFEFTGPYYNVTVTGGSSSVVKTANLSAASQRTLDTSAKYARTIPLPRNRVDSQAPPP